MNTSMVPACMACTVPDVPFVNTASDSSICFMDDNDIEIIPSKEYLYTVVKRAHVSNTDLQIVHFQQNKNTPSRFQPIFNNNRKNRKNHNIYQPGRTNCTQRFQSK